MVQAPHVSARIMARKPRLRRGARITADPWTIPHYRGNRLKSARFPLHLPPPLAIIANFLRTGFRRILEIKGLELELVLNDTVYIHGVARYVTIKGLRTPENGVFFFFFFFYYYYCALISNARTHDN